MAKNHDSKANLENDVDELFKLPLSEFTGARNALASRLKQSGRANDGVIVKALPKPSISAWAVNQLYWQHRVEFERLVKVGQRLQQLQTSGIAGKVANIRASLDERREALAHLSDLATSLLRGAGHNPTLDTIRRVTTTLEALSSYGSLDAGPTPGRLTGDVDPPGFESLASLMPGARTATRITPPQRLGTQAPQKSPPSSDIQKKRQLEETRRARIADAKVAVQNARKSLAEARAIVERLEAAQRKANSDAKEAEQERRKLEQRLKQARAASEETAHRARSIADEAREAAKAVEEANRAVSKASKELESLFRKS